MLLLTVEPPPHAATPPPPGRRFKSWSIIKAIFISWAIAFGEYCLQVPANRCVGGIPSTYFCCLHVHSSSLSLPSYSCACRMGHFSHGGPFTAPQLKIIQEFIRRVCAELVTATTSTTAFPPAPGPPASSENSLMPLLPPRAAA